MKTRVTEILGIEKPILQGGMAWVSDASLAGAVSEAGGLGIISAMNQNADYLRREIEKLRQMTDKPFGVNIMLMSPFVKEVAALVIEERVPVVTTGAGDPKEYMEAWKQAGIKVLPVVASVSLARRMEKSGADIIIAEGTESGGHIGEVSTLALLPQVVDAVKLPVIAAGGIAGGRQMVAVFSLGAEAVQMGTRFLVSEECNIHPHYKESVLKATDISTVVTGRSTGHPVRSLKSPFSREYQKKEQSGDADLEAFAVGALRKAALFGDLDSGCFIAGQVAGMLTKIEPVADILDDVMNDFQKTIRGISLWEK